MKATTAPTSGAGAPRMSLDDPRAIQILATEHWSLLASRTLSWNESFSRASMLLAMLSAAVVSLALVAQVAAFGQAFIVFALIVLPFVEVLGLGTFARLGEANGEDVRYIQGMNRIRHAYLEIAPDLAPYFVTASHDDLPAVFSTYGIAPVTQYSIGRRRLHFAFVTTQGMIGILNAMLAAVFGGLLATLVGLAMAAVVGLGGLLFAIAFGGQLLYGVAIYERHRDALTVRFPAETDRRDPTPAEAAGVRAVSATPSSTRRHGPIHATPSSTHGPITGVVVVNGMARDPVDRTPPVDGLVGDDNLGRRTRHSDRTVPARAR